MAKKELAAPAKRGSKAIKVINVIFWINLILLILVGVFVCMAYTIPSLHDALVHWSVADKFVHQWLVPQVKNQLANLMGLQFPRRSLTEVQTALLYAGIWGVYIFIWFWLMYLPFVVKNKAKRKGVTNKWSLSLCYISFAFAFLFFIGYLTFPYQNSYFSWMHGYHTLMYRWADLFKQGGPMSWFSSPLHITNAFTLSGIFVLLAFILVDICILVPLRFGPTKAVAPAVEETSLPELSPRPVEAAGNQNAAPVVPVPVVVEKKEKLVPTVRELALLNSLEPLESSPVSNLPGLYDTDIEKLVELLEPQIDELLICNDGVEANTEYEYRDSILPGIDEWGANPWPDEENVVITIATPEKEEESVVADIILPEEPVEDVTATAAPVIIPVPVEEKEEIVVDEPITGFIIIADNKHYDHYDLIDNPVRTSVDSQSREDYQIIITDNANSDISASDYAKDNLWVIPGYDGENKSEVIIPEATGKIIIADNNHYDNRNLFENAACEKGDGSSREDYQEVRTDNTHNDVQAQRYSKDNLWTIPSYEEMLFGIDKAFVKTLGGVKVMVMDNSHYDNRNVFGNPVANKSSTEFSRIDFQTIMIDNSHKVVESQKYSKDNLWILPVYQAPKPAANKPVANVKQVELKKVNLPATSAEKPKIAPIAPIVKETVPAEPVVEEKPSVPIIPIVAPLHSTEKSRHEKIEVVKAKKVPFSLKHYKIKTYSGNLTPQEAFEKGITKVQPVAVPIFNNQSQTSDWKQKRRQEDIRKNGYVNVSQVENLDGNSNIAAPSKSSIVAPTSIREMVKAQKNSVKEEESKKDEFKLSKPAAPISLTPVSPTPAKQDAEEKEASRPNNMVKPVAIKPLAPLSKPAKRPDIKPVDPFKKK